MKVNVKTMAGRKFEVDLGDEDDDDVDLTLNLIKDKIQEQQEIPSWRQTLVFDGKKMLEDDTPLADYFVVDGSQLFLMVNTNLKKAPQNWKLKKMQSVKKPAHLPPAPLPVNDNVYLVNGGAHRLIYLRDVVDMRVQRVFEGHRHEITSIVCSDCGQKIISGSKGEIIVWDVPSGLLERRIEGHASPINSLGTTGTIILEASGEPTSTVGEMKMFDLDTGNELISFQGGCIYFL
jgi:hypothetical protein